MGTVTVSKFLNCILVSCVSCSFGPNGQFNSVCIDNEGFDFAVEENTDNLPGGSFWETIVVSNEPGTGPSQPNVGKFLILSFITLQETERVAMQNQ